MWNDSVSEGFGFPVDDDRGPSVLNPLLSIELAFMDRAGMCQETGFDTVFAEEGLPLV